MGRLAKIVAGSAVALAVAGGTATLANQPYNPPAQPSQVAPATPTPEPTEPPAEAPAPAPKTPSNCNPNYSPCIPNSSADLDCADVGEQVTVTGDDVYNLDGDGDGIGCESY